MIYSLRGMIRTSKLPNKPSLSKQFWLAARYPSLIYLDDAAAVVANHMRGSGLFSSKEHVIMFLLMLSEIMKPISSIEN